MAKRNSPDSPELDLPNSGAAEIAVLASILSNSDCLDVVRSIISVQCFFNRSNRTIYEALLELQAESSPIDLVTVTNRLKERGKLEEIGGAHYISKIGVAPIVTMNVEHHAKILADKLLLRKVIAASTRFIQEAQTATDAKALIQSCEAQILSLNCDGAGNTTSDACTGAIEILNRLQSGDNPLVVKTGIQFLERSFRGWERGRMDVIGARPGRGKSALIEQASNNILESGMPVLIFQKDMTPKKMVLRMACRRAGVSLTKLIRNSPTAEEIDLVRQQIDSLSKTPLFIESPSRLTGSDIRSLIRRYRRNHGVEVVILDHFQTLSAEGRDYRLGMTQNSLEIKAAIQESDVAGVILAQLNRGADVGEKPHPKDIKECDQLFTDCDTLMLLWSKQDPEELDPGEYLEVIGSIYKDRNGIPIRDVKALFDGRHMQFISYAKKNETTAAQ